MFLPSSQNEEKKYQCIYLRETNMLSIFMAVLIIAQMQQQFHTSVLSLVKFSYIKNNKGFEETSGQNGGIGKFCVHLYP